MKNLACRQILHSLSRTLHEYQANKKAAGPGGFL